MLLGNRWTGRPHWPEETIGEISLHRFRLPSAMFHQLQVENVPMGAIADPRDVALIIALVNS